MSKQNIYLSKEDKQMEMIAWRLVVSSAFQMNDVDKSPINRDVGMFYLYLEFDQETSVEQFPCYNNHNNVKRRSIQ